MKRIVDIALSSFLLVMLLPILLVTLVMIKVDSSGPVLFRQKRLGYHAVIFDLLKFRSMTDFERALTMQTVGDESDVTRVGRLLRRFKIDELPQLINVLRGDMSIVGPRPCLPELQGLFNKDGQMRLTVRPGLTGLAQINGNIHLSWPERWKYDRQYIENQSLWFDVKIIAITLMIVLLGEKWGVNR